MTAEVSIDDTPPPRQLEDLLAEVDAELKKADLQ
jgi:hypothetical protein